MLGIGRTAARGASVAEKTVFKGNYRTKQQNADNVVACTYNRFCMVYHLPGKDIAMTPGKNALTIDVGPGDIRIVCLAIIVFVVRTVRDNFSECFRDP